MKQIEGLQHVENVVPNPHWASVVDFRLNPLLEEDQQWDYDDETYQEVLQYTRQGNFRT